MSPQVDLLPMIHQWGALGQTISLAIFCLPRPSLSSNTQLAATCSQCAQTPPTASCTGTRTMQPSQLGPPFCAGRTCLPIPHSRCRTGSSSWSHPALLVALLTPTGTTRALANVVCAPFEFLFAAPSDGVVQWFGARRPIPLLSRPYPMIARTDAHTHSHRLVQTQISHVNTPTHTYAHIL